MTINEGRLEEKRQKNEYAKFCKKKEEVYYNQTKRKDEGNETRKRKEQPSCQDIKQKIEG